MTCQDDANFVGPVSLFCGIETANWSNQQFLAIGNFCKQHGIKTLFIKVSEVGSRAGDIWYGGIDGFDKNVYQPLKAIGINVIPYQFSYGPSSSNFQTDINIAVQFIQKYNVHCLDIEGADWEGDTNSAAAKCASQLAAALKPLPGKLWLSLPADYANNNQNATFQALAAATNVFMPMAYSDHLTQVYKSQMLALNSGACIQPTLDLSQEFGANDVLANAKKIKADGCPAVSLWYEGFATQNPSLVDQIVSVFGGSPSVQPPPTTGGTNVKLDSNGCVMTVPKSFQLESGESPDLCGPQSVVAVAHSVPPGQTSHTSNEDIDVYTDNMVDSIFGGNVNHNNFLGVAPSDMITIMNHVRDDTGLIHYWVIDVKNIEKAIQAGYPVIFSCNEADLTVWNKGKQAWEHAYPWQLSAGHVLPVVGIEQGTGNWIIADQLNNSYQGYWPPIYKASDLKRSLSWAAIIQVVGPDKNKPFLAPIPSGDPNAWPQGFNAQLFAGGTVPPSPTPPPAPTTDFKSQAMNTTIGRWPKLPEPPPQAIIDSYKAEYTAGRQHGILVDSYANVDWNGSPIWVCEFTRGAAEDNQGKVTWY